MTEKTFKLPQTPAERFVSDVTSQLNEKAQTRRQVVKTLGFSSVTLADLIGVSDVTVSGWMAGRTEPREDVRRRIGAALILRYIKLYNPNGLDKIPPFESL